LFLSLCLCTHFPLSTHYIFPSQLLSVSTRQSKPHSSYYNTLYSITPTTFSSHSGTRRYIPPPFLHFLCKLLSFVNSYPHFPHSTSD
jgi:hypothetical protein